MNLLLAGIYVICNLCTCIQKCSKNICLFVAKLFLAKSLIILTLLPSLAQDYCHKNLTFRDFAALQSSHFLLLFFNVLDQSIPIPIRLNRKYFFLILLLKPIFSTIPSQFTKQTREMTGASQSKSPNVRFLQHQKTKDKSLLLVCFYINDK